MRSCSPYRATDRREPDAHGLVSRARHRTVTGTFASDAWPHAVGSAVAGYGKPSQLASATNGPSARPLLTWAMCDGNTWMKSNAP